MSASLPSFVEVARALVLARAGGEIDVDSLRDLVRHDRRGVESAVRIARPRHRRSVARTASRLRRLDVVVDELERGDLDAATAAFTDAFTVSTEDL